MKEPTSVSMADKQMTKIKFATKLTLPRFIAVVERLTDKHQMLVRSMGFGHLLDLKCDTLLRGLAQWLAMRFNVKTRCLDLPNGLSINFNPFCIHQILGIPLGGRRINKKHSDAVRVLIAEETGCKGNYPTISELDELITTELDGDAFKRVFLQFALTSFLCPSSHDGASPDYYSALEVPDDIPKFDWCTIALDKLVLSIDNFQKEGATVLGGNLLSLVIFYDEFLDTTIMSDTVILPRLSVWTTQLVMEYEKMDCTSEDGLYYGRLPAIIVLVKDISQTPFKMINSSPKTIPNIAHDEILEFVLSVVPEEKHEMVRDELPRIMDNFCKDLLCSMQDPTFLDNLCKALLSSIQPVVTQHMVSMFKLLLPASPVIADNNSKINDEKREIKDKRHIISSLPVDNPVLLQTTGRGKDVPAGTRTNCLIGPETDKLVRAKHDPMTPHESKAAAVTTEKILSNTSKQIGACMHPVHGKDKPMLLQITGHGKDVPAVTRTDCLIGPETDKLVGMNIVQRTPHESKVAPVTRDKNLSNTSEQIGDSMHAFQIPALKPDEEIAMSNEYSRPERRMNNVEKVDPLTCKKLDFPQALFQKAYENPVGLSFHLSKRSTDRFLDKIDMVYLPLSASGFWYLIIANFRRRIFEVLCPIRKIELITDEAKSAIYSFQRAFRNAYPRSEINIFDMDQTFVTVSSSVKESDSGIFIMKLIQSHTGETDFFFRPEYAKAIREQLTFYLISHPCNVQLKPEAKRILAKYNIPYDYQTPGYYPWMPSSAM